MGSGAISLTFPDSAPGPPKKAPWLAPKWDR